ncbi:copper resistance CopC family protein [Micromonospora endolithica]|uniref:Copper resistance protein CopC n=1 Tax=Micromonospora endolithica TaxID=230091 RepID=A0A3A9ZI69_9ACTN|nr:copper resistance protein CopC [Micromonospora endolithica]RKN47940.1 copper resistance protein CopC [Micromonospora endolithica]TWJ21411.1 methionine-rich copper-binding protein CopC [Micromonospora endolithica]
MRRPRSVPRRPISGLLALVVVALVLLVPAGPVSAHGSLAMSTPAPGASVAQPLTEVSLYFTEKVAPNAYLTVTAPGGGRVDGGWRYGEPKPLDRPVREYFLVNGTFEPREYTTGFPAVVRVAHLPAVGQYTVSYLSLASDGEPVRGTLTFRYTGRATPPPAGWSPPTDQPDPALVTAAAQHETSGHGPEGQTTAAAAPVVSSAPTPAVAGPPASDEGGPGLLAWGGAVALAAVLAGLLLRRRRPAPVRRLTGRSRAPGAAPRRGGGAGRARPAGRGGTGRRTGTGSTRQPTATTRKGGAAGAADAGSTATRKTAPAAAPPDGDRAAVVPVDGPDLSAAGPTFGPRTSNTRLALVVGAVVVALLAGFGLGRTGTGERVATGGPAGPAAGSGDPDQARAASAGDGHQHVAGTGPHTHPGDGAGQNQVAGTAVSAAGYTMRPVRRTQPAGAGADYQFRVVGTDGQPVTRFVTVHDKPLHLIVVGRDLDGYQHLHPTMAPDGTWTVPLALTRAGSYRVYADFSVAGPDGGPVPLVLGVDHHVPGAYAPVALPPAGPRATAGPYTVAMGGTPTAGVTVPLDFRVSPAGTPDPVALQRYLGAYGHLVVVREGDLGYVHVHPESELVDGAVRFWLTAPSAGRYRAFLDFQVDGAVHTAAYTVDVP